MVIMNLLFFDTNFLFYSNTRFNSAIANKIKESDYDIFTSEIVVSEGKNKNIREICDLYKKYKSFMNDEKLKLYVDLNEHAEFDESKVKEESNRRIDAYIKEYFGDNVISSVDDAQIGRILFDRYQLKQPPFINVENSSDKGWKDTLIWVSFIQYCIGKEYDCFYFVSKDKGFINQQDRLKEEFSNCVGKSIVFINSDSFEDLFLSLGITKKEKADNKRISDNIREEIILSIDDFTEFDEASNAFGDTIKANAFSFVEKPTLEEIEKFCNMLNDSEPSFVFMKTVDLSEIISRCFFLASANCTFALSAIRAFLKSWNVVLKEYPDCKAYFLKAVELKFEKSIQNLKQEKTPGDLPF